MIKILKSGSWALGGTQVVELTEGEEVSFGSANNCEIVDSGWAEWAKIAEAAEELRKPKPKAK